MTDIHASRNAIAGFHGDRPAGVAAVELCGQQWLAARAPIPWHAHARWEVYHQLDGTAWWEDRHAAHRLTPGRGYLAPPGVEHRLLRIEGDRHQFRFAVIDLDGCLAGKRCLLADARALARAGRLIVADGDGLAPAIQHLTAGAVRGGPHRGEVVRTAVAALAAAAVDWAVAPRPADLAPGHRAVAQVRRRIAADPGRAWTLASLAAGTGVGGKHLCTIFRAEVGTTPLRHLLDVRLARVADGLRRGGPGVGELAEALGFASSQHLSRRFAERYGVPPSRWRRQAPG